MPSAKFGASCLGAGAAIGASWPIAAAVLAAGAPAFTLYSFLLCPFDFREPE
jgi:hypothetical protein